MPRPPDASGSWRVHDCGAFVFKAAAHRRESVIREGAYDRLIVVLSGFSNITWDENGERRFLRAGPGDVVYQPGDRKWIEFNDPSPRLTSICIQFRWSNPWTDNICPKVPDRLGLIHTLADAILSILPSASPHRRSMENGYLAAALAEYRRLAEQEGEVLVPGVTRYVYDHIREHIALEDLAKNAGLSPRHFQRRFKAGTGKSPMQFVRFIRAKTAARSLIRSHPGPLKDLAMRVGICSEQALCKLLKTHTGLTGSELRAGKSVPRAEARSNHQKR